MKTYKATFDKPVSDKPYTMARIPKQFESIRVIDGSEEDIFNETFVSCVINNRVIKFKKSVLEFISNGN